MPRASAPGRTVAALFGTALAIAGFGCAAKDFSPSDREGEFARIGLAVKAEKVVHRSEPFLLVTLRATDTRRIDRPDGRVDTVLLGQQRLAFLPMKIDCAGMRATSQGNEQKPHLVSLCSAEGSLATPGAMPLFVAFPYPRPGTTTVRVPVNVLPPDPPIRTSLAPMSSFDTPRVTTELLGRRVLSFQVVVD